MSVYDLVSDPVLRAVPLARTQASKFEVDILGLLFGGGVSLERFAGMFEDAVDNKWIPQRSHLFQEIEFSRSLSHSWRILLAAIGNQ